MCKAVCAHACSRRCTGTLVFEETHEQKLLAATLSAGDGSAVSHRSATAYWGVDGFRCEIVEITHPFEHHLRLRDVVLHRSFDLVHDDIAFVGPLPVTSRIRTLIDLGAVARPWLVSRALEQWLREGQVTVRRFATRSTSSHVGAGPGAGVLRKVLDDRVLRFEASDSHAEVVLAYALQAHGGPPAAVSRVDRPRPRHLRGRFPLPRRDARRRVDGYGPHTQPEVFRGGSPPAEPPHRRRLHGPSLQRSTSHAPLAHHHGRDRGGPQRASHPRRTQSRRPSGLSADATENASGGVRGGGRR